MRIYPQPAVAESFTSAVVCAAWNVDPVRRGPFMRHGPARRTRIDGIVSVRAGVDDSTLLQNEQSAPLLMVNYARLPDEFVRVSWNQLLRKSFHQYPRVLLKSNSMTSLPSFIRPVANGSTRG